MKQDIAHYQYVAYILLHGMAHVFSIFFFSFPVLFSLQRAICAVASFPFLVVPVGVEVPCSIGHKWEKTREKREGGE